MTSTWVECKNCWDVRSCPGTGAIEWDHKGEGGSAEQTIYSFPSYASREDLRSSKWSLRLLPLLVQSSHPPSRSFSLDLQRHLTAAALSEFSSGPISRFDSGAVVFVEVSRTFATSYLKMATICRRRRRRRCCRLRRKAQVREGRQDKIIKYLVDRSGR